MTNEIFHTDCIQNENILIHSSNIHTFSEDNQLLQPGSYNTIVQIILFYFILLIFYFFFQKKILD